MVNKIVELSKIKGDSNELSLVGSRRQQLYANDIIQRIKSIYPNAKLPNVRSARFWIEAQDKTPDELIELSKQINTAFTESYPKFHRDVAIDALQQIMNNLDSVCVIDTETSGLGKHAAIVEIGIVKYIHRKPTIVYESLVKPEHINLSQYGKSKASQVNSITAEMLRHAPTLKSIYKHVEPYLHQHVICFNSFFDINMIIRSIKHYENLTVPDIRSTDLMKLAQCYYELPDVPSLDELTHYLNMRIPKTERHRAAFDSLITAKALLKLYQLSRKE